jgi:predicted phosphodiesterase
MIQTNVREKLERLFEDSPALSLTDRDRLVILSDLHVGDGGLEDEFAHNSNLCIATLRNHYLPNGFKLVLNGDVEELHKFPLKRILRAWRSLYGLLDEYRDTAGLFKIAGNHDFDSLSRKHPGSRLQSLAALRIQTAGNELFVFHGHQASRLSAGANRVSRWALRWIAKPLSIRNYSVAYDNDKKYRIEQRVYDFARDRGIVAVIGHTHRPLFESLSRIDYLKFQIETLCRAFIGAGPGEQIALRAKIKTFQQELEHTLKKDKRNGSRSSVYHPEPLLPCLFNSGCAVGKRGITAIEIAGGRIALVHWFDRTRSDKYFTLNGFSPERLEATDYYRVVLKEDTLAYVFARITLLS